MNEAQENFKKYNFNYKTKMLTSNYYDACMIIPYGKKCFLWFTYITNEPCCICIETNQNKDFLKAYKILVRFDISLAIGTVCFASMKNNIITIEDIFLNERKQVQLDSFEKKCHIFKSIMSKIKNDPLCKFTIRLACIKHTFNEILKIKI